MIDKVIRFCLVNKLVVALLVIAVIGWGVLVAPFDWDTGPLPRDPVPTDAIPDIGENQQIVFTEWMGRSPQDVEDQISYPLTVALLGVPGVKTIRSYSFFGFSSIYVIFDEDVEFYWSRTRVLEKLNSLPSGTLPEGVQPALGPDATPLGQIYWYSLEGRDPDGKPVGGWDLNELRTIQDWYVRYYLLSAEGISEVASVGGFVQEYQIDVDPDAMRAARVNIDQIFMAVKRSNIDVGARTIEINKAEYFIRGLGFVEDVEDLEYSVVAVNDNVPIYVKDVARVSLGPALRRGALDKGGAEAVGGVVVVRYGFNPLEAIKNVKAKIDEFDDGLPTKAVVDYRQVTRDELASYAEANNFDALAGDDLLNHDAWVKHLRSTPREQWPAWVTTSQVTVVPFYDRTGLIYETLGTLNKALIEEILVTVIVILVMVMHLRSSLLISTLLPLAVLMCFIAMKTFGVDANIVALSGIAIAIGTMVDMGVILCENILNHLDEADEDEDRLEVVFRAASEVGGAVVTAVATTIVSFLPVFTMIGAEGKLFKPLAFTKTFALAASVIVALTIIPPVAHILFTAKVKTRTLKQALYAGLVVAGIVIGIWLAWWAGLIIAALGAFKLVEESLPERLENWRTRMHGLSLLLANGAAVLLVGTLLTDGWLPLGPEKGFLRNFVFVGVLIGGLLAFFQVFQEYLYKPLLRWCLDHKLLFLTAPALILLLGFGAWLGPAVIFGRIPQEYESQSLADEDLAELSALEEFKYELAGIRSMTWDEDIAGRPLWTKFKWTLAQSWEGFGKEFMPPLDEGSFLYMPTTMPHASIGEAMNVLQLQDRRINAIPEVELAVGKLGRVKSPLDPAPISMIETVINYKSEYVVDKDGHRIKYQFDPDEVDFFRDAAGMPLPADDGQPYKVQGKFVRDNNGDLVEDPDGVPFRQWRASLDPALNPGRTAWAGIVKPDDIWHEIVDAAQVPGTTSAPRLQPIAARIVMLQSGMRAPMGVKVKGPDLDTIERVALEIERFLKEVPSVQASAVIADRIVGKPYLEIDFDRKKIARYGLNIQDVQDVVEVAIGGMPITTTVEGRERFAVRVRYMRELRDEIEELGKILVPAKDGSHIPLSQVAKINYVRGPQVIKSEDTFLIGYVLFDMKAGEAEVNVVEDSQRYLQEKIDSGEFNLPDGVSYTFAGNYENQVRSQKTLMVVLPLALFIIFIILYMQFKSVMTTSLVFSGIGVAWAGGFIMLWLYGQPWFLDFSVFGTNMQSLFQIHPINLSVAVWVGFLALFGIATDDGVVITTYLDQSFFKRRITTSAEARAATLAAGLRRVRPCLMTTATTILALIPVLTSTGRGSDIMVPMAIPSVGGMMIAIMTMLVVPVLYCSVQEWKIRLGIEDPRFAQHAASAGGVESEASNDQPQRTNDES
ncbi:MAG: AcrB/AcrD/AcrF family protein [Planctomycetota bacterium]|nr:MAG: AcrB/AcrD/AcrF family protein [Planctomycetota bacterium]REJ96871.1 MAG: AcrB/AcrD/AcrF family protein [Planctomycetota bacterium]REK24059.1 MAG: AcrB/AcrD/AcrF family protein [Planctomycetota bacterium]REK39502.1 MAG: AcrB/AcrD/AcrF family protein [Planctomycetota bacterium]